MTDPLVSVARLRELIGEVSVLDVRFRMGGPTGHEPFLAGHVPGAAYVDLDLDLAAQPGPGGRHPLPDPDTFIESMQRAGVSHDRTVVVYDDWSGQAAARAWWLLRDFGHPDVLVLDGGWAAWVDAGGATDTGPVTPDRGDFEGRPGAMPVVDAAAVPGVEVLIDARAGARYSGAEEHVDPVAGHIPGAVNVPTGDNLDADGHFRDPDHLREVYAAVGAHPGTHVAVYCGSGVTAAHAVLALEVIGVSAALYPGSWSEWILDPRRPVATG